jgi:hypothetical protein
MYKITKVGNSVMEVNYMFIKKGITTVFITTVIILNLLLVSSFVIYSNKDNNENLNKTSITGLQAVEIATKAFPIAFNKAGYNKDDIKYEIKDFWGKNGGKVWSVTLDPMDIKQTINIDTMSGMIRSFTITKDYSKINAIFSPNYTFDEMKKIVDSKISEMQPELSKEVVFTGVDYDNKNNLNGVSTPTFITLNYARKINNLTYAWDGFKVRINSYDGAISYYEFTWSFENLPNEFSILSMDKAKQQFLKYGAPRLIYVRPWANSNSNEGRKLKLIYSIVNGSYYYQDFNAIDAKTGDPVNAAGRPANLNFELIGDKADQSINKGTEKASNSINENDAKEIAIKEALKYNIKMDLNDKYVTSLSNNYNGINYKVFTISWSKDLEKDNISYSFSIDLDTGKILGFHYNKKPLKNIVNNSNLDNNKLTWQDGRNQAVAFVKNNFPQFLGNISLMENEPMISGKLGGSSYYYSFWRTVNGVLYPENNVNIIIDKNSREIVGYGYKWEYIDFPDATAGIISDKTASDVFINQIGLRLNSRSFVSNNSISNTMNNDILVYEANSTNAEYIDAYTGKLKDINGDDVVLQAGLQNNNTK